MTKFVLLCSLLCILSANAATPKLKKSLSRTTSTRDESSDKYLIPKEDTSNFTSLEDYHGFFLRRLWQLQGGTISLIQRVTGAIELTWENGDTSVKITKYVTGAVDQDWKFGNANILIKNYVTGAVDQTWNLGKKSYKYSRACTGRTNSNGSATAQDRERYQREIDAWCNANQRFLPAEYCVRYDAL